MTEINLSKNAPEATLSRQGKNRHGIETAIFVLLLLLVIAAPWWTKAAVLLFRVALVLWLGKLVFLRRRVPHFPLVKPLLAYILLAALSTFFSPEPGLSWGRMRTVLLCTLAFIIFDTLHSIRRVRVLIFALLASGVAVAGFTAWQYAAGIGVVIVKQSFPEELVATGIHRSDIVYSINGTSVRSGEDWQSQLEKIPSGDAVHIALGRGSPPQAMNVFVPGELFRKADLVAAQSVRRARPDRAQGLFYSYIPFAELLMLLCALSWGLVLTIRRRSKSVAAIVVIGFALLVFALVATETRAVLAAFLLAAAVTLWLAASGRFRIAGTAVLLAVVIAGSVWFHRTRAGQGWFDSSDPGTQYRELMWQDGLHLIRQHPWLGVGMDTVETRGRELGIRAYEKYPNLKSHFHSNFIQIAVESGLPALAAWMWLMTAYLILLAKLQSRLRNGDRFTYGLALGLLAAAIACNAASFVHYINGDAEVMIVFWFLFGIGLSLAKEEVHPQQA